MNKNYDFEEKNSLVMQFGGLVTVIKKKVYPKRVDTRTKEYNNQRKHKGVMGKYKKKENKKYEIF